MGLQDLFNKGPGNGLDRPTVASSTPSHTAGTYHINKAKMDVKMAARKVAAKEGQRDLLLKQRAEAEKRGEAAERQLDVFDKVLILLQLTSDYARQQIKGRIE
jgi:hypothetical protein